MAQVLTPPRRLPLITSAATETALIPPAVRAPTWQRLIAMVALIVIGIRIELIAQIELGMLVAVVLSPFWIPVLKRVWGARPFVLVGVLAVGSGAWLAALSSVDHDVGANNFVSAIVLIAGSLAMIGVILWARTVMRDSSVAVWFGVGLILGVTPTSALYLSNPWRFGYSVAITIVLLAISMHLKRRWVEVLVLIVLTGVTTITDARSSFAILLLTTLLVLWQVRPGNPSKRIRAVIVVGVLLGLSAVVYFLGQSLILGGAFGSETQQRSVAQVDDSGSLILGGRPEIAATTALFIHQPWGFGAGVSPTPNDVLVAKAGLLSINYEPNNGYVNNYMFGGHIELHSVIGDLWAAYGFAGVVFAGLIIFLSLRTLGSLIGSRGASGLLIYLGIKVLWSMFFGPVFSSLPLIILFIGLALTVKTPTAVAPSPVSNV